MWIRFSGLLGLVIFLFGFVSSLLLGQFNQRLLMLHMGAGLLLMLTWFFTYGLKNMNRAGEALRGRSVRFGANVVLYSAVVIGLLVVVYYFASRNDKRWDLTENAVYSLAQQSKSVLDKLEQPLKIVAFKGISPANEEELKDQIEMYERYNPKQVDADIIDARTKPHLLEKYEMKPGNLVYLEYGSGDKKAVSRINEGTEQAITNAIIKLARGAAKKIYYVIGHNEPDITSDQAMGLSAFSAAVSDEQLTLETILLSQHEKMPDDAAAVILCSPKRPLLKEELEFLKNYANSGGRLLLFHDPRTTSDVKELAAAFNIKIADDVVIDQIQRLFAAPALGAQPVVRQYAVHPITANLKTDDITVFNIASSVEAESGADSDARIVSLAKTGASAWGEVDLEALFDEANPSATFDTRADKPGPVSLAAAYERKHKNDSEKKEGDTPEFEKMTRVVVFGDSDWILNANLSVYSNRDFVLSSLNWLVGEEGGVSIGKRNMRLSDAPMTREDFMLLLAASFIVPEVILIVGLFIWWRRRNVFAV